MRRTLHWFPIFALAVACATASATPADDRARALAGLDDPSPSARAAAVAWLAKNGTPADDVLVLPRLTDDDARVRAAAERGTWILWSRSGDEAVDALMARGARQLDRRDLEAAVATYTEVIERRPAFAEGWNKRATAYFLMGDLDRSQKDCEEVLKRNPYHFGALSGYGQLWFQWKRYDKAIEYWQRAMKVNPNLVGLRRNVEMARKLLAESSKSST
ncbi:MAG: tetratricopeptide repeat protein [Burkholderiales bacterium]